MERAEHPLCGYPEDQKIDYISLVGSIASADGSVTDDELSQLRQYCETIGIGGMGIGLVLSALEAPEVIDVQAMVKRLSHTDLRFTLVTDMLFMAYADGTFSSEEYQKILTIAEKLDVSPHHINIIKAYISAVIAAQRAISGETEWELAGRRVAIQLTEADIPAAMVAASGCFCRSEDSGYSAGLRAFSLGFGITLGRGRPMTLGTRGFFGIQWLLNKLSYAV